MPAPFGLFDSFDNLDQISIADIARWLKVIPNEIQLENYLANRILYPQSVPQTAYDMQIDLAILREALIINGPKPKQQSPMLGDNAFLNITLRKILIPARFLPFTPTLVSLTWAFVDAFLLNRRKEDWFEDLWTVVLTDEVDEIIGSIILPQFKKRGATLQVTIKDKSYKVTPGILTVVPCPQDRCEIVYKLNQGEILGKDDSAIEIYGGRLGLMIDGRSK